MAHVMTAIPSLLRLHEISKYYRKKEKLTKNKNVLVEVLQFLL